MNGFDAGLLHWLNQFANCWALLDHGVGYLADSYLFKGEALMLVLWWFWFAPSKHARKNQEIILATVAAAAAAILLGRILAHALPFRGRPLIDPTFAFPLTANDHMKLRDWSAFPSDHALLFTSMATGIFFLSRRTGAAAWAYVVVMIGLPRVYLGLHHPTDLLAGGALGTALAWTANREQMRKRLARRPLAWLDAHPSSFYACFFLFSFQIATMFDEPRELVHIFAKLLGRGQ